jgi:hypothetical protein
MGKKDLKKQYTNLDVSVIDYVSRIAKKEFSDITNNGIDLYIIEMLIDVIGDGYQGLETLREFNEHLENNRIENTDINQYETWEDLLIQKGIADVKQMDKQLTKQVERIYEDSTWLVIKPLSFSASLAYGSGTKWCTAMKMEPTYFYRYASEGILLYVINKVNGKKYGFNSSPNEFSVWNTIDNRIDSLESGVPYEILSIIREKSNLSNNPKNSELFSDEEIKNKDKYYGQLKMVPPLYVITDDEERVYPSEMLTEDIEIGDYTIYESQAYSEEGMEEVGYFIGLDDVQQG